MPRHSLYHRKEYQHLLLNVSIKGIAVYNIVMNLIKVIPIYRNKFQEPILFFSSKKFSVGSIVLTLYGKKNKPSLIVEINSLEEKKFFLRSNKIKIQKIDSDFELSLLKNEIIEFIFKILPRTNYKINEIFQKVIPLKIIQEINKIDEKTNPLIDRVALNKKLTANFIGNELIKAKKPVQEDLVGDVGIKKISSFLSQTKKTKSSLHSEKHYLADEIRNYFGETAEKGKGSFGFYIGFFKRIPTQSIYQYWSEAKQSKHPRLKQQKIFWWKIGQHLKDAKK